MNEIQNKILKLKKEKNALILAHYYQTIDIQEVADFVGEKLAPVEGVSQTTTMFVLKKYKVNGVAMDLEPEVEDDRMPVSA